MRKFLSYIFILLGNAVFAQKNLSATADSLYQVKDFNKAAALYLQSASASDFKVLAAGNYYNAACCYALAGKPDSAIIFAKQAVASGYRNIDHMKSDADFASLLQRDDWRKFIASLKFKPTSTSDPLKARIITTDIDNYWKAHDLAEKDSNNRIAIYKQYYLDHGTPGLQDYFAYKVHSLKNYVKSQDTKHRFYAAIRKNTLSVKKQKPLLQASFIKFKELYPAARFPDIYFVIGAFTSGGTSTDNGLLIGVDQAVRTPDIPTDELTLWERNNFGALDYIPNLIAHELIHFNQNGMAADKTLLSAVMVEGMADFLGELISGRTANERLHVWAKGREKAIWADFEKEMNLQRAYNWIANSNQETADKPADLGYWVGYQICKGYYDNSTDKKQAIYDMLNVKDYKAFYKKSGTGEKFGR